MGPRRLERATGLEDVDAVVEYVLIILEVWILDVGVVLIHSFLSAACREDKSM